MGPPKAKGGARSLKPVDDGRVGKRKAAPADKGGKGKAKQQKKKAKKDPNAPKKAQSAFFVFLGEFREEFKKKNPNVKGVAAVGKAGGEKWRSMSDAEKAPYEAKSAKAKIEYEKQMKIYEKKQSAPDDDDDDEGSERSRSEVHDDDDEASGEEAQPKPAEKVEEEEVDDEDGDDEGEEDEDEDNE